MKKTHLKFLAMLFIAFGVMMSCSDDDDNDPDSDGDHDDVHELVVQITDENGLVQEYEFEAEHDHDGDDDDDDDDHDHEEVEIDLLPNHTYTVKMIFKNEDEEDITSDIPKKEHLVCFEVEDANLTIVRNDQDENGIEVGFDSTWTTGAESEGELEVIVRHQIDKASIGTENCEAGGADVEADFHVHIES